MFDNETSMNLTACIFGLSTLLSSYQIYNVQNRIQEDNLQHLALFSEYGRIALAGGDKAEIDADILMPDEDAPPFQRVEFLVRHVGGGQIIDCLLCNNTALRVTKDVLLI